MAITFVDSTTNGATSGTAVSVTKPTGLQANDVVIVIVHSNGPKNVSDNNGTEPFTSALANREYNGPSAQVDIFYRVITGDEGATFDFTLSGSDRWSIVASAYRGVDGAAIWDVAPTSSTENTGTGATNTTNSLTTTVDGAMAIAFAVNDSSSVTFTGTPGDSYNSRENNSGEQLLALADKVISTATTQSAISWTQSASNGTWLNNHFALKPASTDTNIAIVQVAASVSRGNQSITTTDLDGAIPKAAIFIASRATSNGTAANTAVVSFGAADGTNQWAVSGRSQHGVSTMNTDRIASNNRCIHLLPTSEGYASFVSWKSNGVTINWGDATEVALKMTVIFFAGDDLSVHANKFTANSTQNAATDVTDPGFEPEILFTGTTGVSTNNTVTGHNIFDIGIVTNTGGSVTQNVLLFEDEDNLSTSELQADLNTSYGTGQIHNGSITWAGEFGSFDSSGFSCTTRLSGSGGDEVYYLAITTGGTKSVWSGVVNSPVSTGNNSETGPGFQPDFVFQIESMLTATDSIVTTGDAGALGFSMFNTSQEHTFCIASEDNVGTSNTQNLIDLKAVTLTDDAGTNSLVATYVSMDSSGWTLNWTTVDASARKFIALAIGTSTAAGRAEWPILTGNNFRGPRFT